MYHILVCQKCLLRYVSIAMLQLDNSACSFSEHVGTVLSIAQFGGICKIEILNVPCGAAIYPSYCTKLSFLPRVNACLRHVI
eukprot:m.407108 g.407108  ORF g.407108 m.407108 type:complete len:82 (-) comp21219_c0_seq4:1115-1360(-)